MRLQGSAQIFGLTNAALSPVLVGLAPEGQLSATSVKRLVFLVDTVDRARQKLYTGLYRLTLSPAIPTADGAKPSVSVRPLLAEDAYRGPLTLSPDRRHLAYFVLNPARPSQSSGLIQPPNELYILALDGLNAGRTKLAYGAATRFNSWPPTWPGWTANG